LASYEVSVARSVQKFLLRVPKKDVQNIVSSIERLAQNPYPDGCRKLRGEESVYRIRQGQYRIVYEVLSSRLVVLILKVGHRKSVYR